MADGQPGSPGAPDLPALRPPAAGPYRVCLVCTGNICRSPMAEVVLRQLAGAVPGLIDRLEVSSAGTGAWHVGEPMDPRARDALARRGYRDHGHVARQVDAVLATDPDLLVALDRGHRRELHAMRRGAPVVLLGAFGPGADAAPGPQSVRQAEAGRVLDVPDPYYGGAADFGRCLHQIERSCRGLVAALAALLAGGTA